MKELHTFGWYAARVSPYLPKEAFKPVPARLWGGLAYFIVIVAGILTIGLFDFNMWLYLVISVILGASFAGTCFLGHEILHGTVVRKKWLRDLLGAIAFFPVSTGPELWRKWHNMNHHIHTQHEELDPDHWSTIEQLSKRPFLRSMYRLPRFIRSISYFCFLTINFSLVSFNMFVRYVKEFNSKKKLSVWAQFMLPWAAWIALLFWMGPVKWLFAYVLPLLIANFIMSSYIATNHNLNPLVPVNDPLANTLSVTVPRWVDVLHFNFSYHAEHHLFPGMNPKYYPLVKEQIKKMWPDRYHEMSFGRAMVALWKTPRIYHNKKELIDPELGNTYGTLGNGLDSKEINDMKTDSKERIAIKRSSY
jgi:fatty acid desaturase